MLATRLARRMVVGAVLIGLVYLGFLLVGIRSDLSADSGSSAEASGKSTKGYIVLAWNDLGMHCYNGDYADIAVLPPYNNLWAQVIKVGNPPQVVTSGVTISYSFPGNTYSAGVKGKPDKTNFWSVGADGVQYAQELFGLSAPLPANVGLKGNGLSGQMKLSGDHYVAEGIPLTEYTDKDARGKSPATWVRSPYQLADIVVKDSKTGVVLATNKVVAPVSSELNCASCHADDGDATTAYPITPTGNVNQNILLIHDYLSGTELTSQRPVLCADCHSSNALDAAGLHTGQTGIASLSNAMHTHHNRSDIMDITPDKDGCFNCHPGPVTQCLRDTMTQNDSMDCVNCHGTLGTVALNKDPWLNEPRCDNAACHGAGFAQNQPLYRLSTGHGSLYCAGCHDSPHAIAQSREPNDATKFVNLQGEPGTLRKCTTCHASQPTGVFHHTGFQPIVDSPMMNAEPSVPGDSVMASAAFVAAPSIPAGSSFTCTVDYGDGSGAVSGTIAYGVCFGPSHTYVAAGRFSVTATVTTSDGATLVGTGSRSVVHVVK